MKTFEFYNNLKEYLLREKVNKNVTIRERSEIRRASVNFVIKDHQLFYTGPNRQYFRLVVMSEEQKRAVLTECHDNPGTGNHHGVRGTRDRVITGYFWPSLIKDVANWVRCCHRCQLNGPIKTVTPVLHSVKNHFSNAQFDSGGALLPDAVPDQNCAVSRNSPSGTSSNTENGKAAPVPEALGLIDHSYCKSPPSLGLLEDDCLLSPDETALETNGSYNVPAKGDQTETAVQNPISLKICGKDDPRPAVAHRLTEKAVIDHVYCALPGKAKESSIEDPADYAVEVTAVALNNFKDCLPSEKDELIHKLKVELERKDRMLALVFHPDQIKYLESRLYRPGSGHEIYKWSSSTISDCLKIRYACGINGYEYLRKELKYPIPSYRTITRHLKTVEPLRSRSPDQDVEESPISCSPCKS
ncbi:GIN1 protein, partial [Polypterus senegalus]|nr:uncharacterized protein LOC120533094 isoform X1 [Polypterus senegalus]XP_039615722.1 uncharacterized protein LOC120533094 isoform X1 [Polypterus senegalus]MBN3293093.1 GIN1 protein [Polypterus senegalus]